MKKNSKESITFEVIPGAEHSSVRNWRRFCCYSFLSNKSWLLHLLRTWDWNLNIFPYRRLKTIEDFLSWIVAKAFEDQGKDSGFWQLSWVSPDSQFLHFKNPISHSGTQSHLHLLLGQWEEKKGRRVTWGKNWKILADEGFLAMQKGCRSRWYFLFLRKICKLHSLGVHLLLVVANGTDTG